MVRALEEYRRKRDFTKTPEPSGDAAPRRQGARSAWDSLAHGRRFCVQMHRATRLHFDFRLEHDGVLLSWAIPRGPTLDPSKKRLAVQTEDHPIDYGDFEGVIPSGYGAGTVLLWDIGTYEWVRESAEDFAKSFARGDVKFKLAGSKIAGEFALVKIGDRGRRYGGSSDSDRNWLMIKKRDSAVIEGFEATEHEVSVITGHNLAQIAAEGGGDPRQRRRDEAAQRPRPPADGEAGASAQPAAPPQPMLATLVNRPFSAEGWMFELKYDGVRALASIAGGTVKLTGRSGRDETARYPELQRMAAAVHATDAILDGEIVVFGDAGRPSFERLQSRINVSRQADIDRAAREYPVVYVAFDILRLDGRDLMLTSLRIRKKTLRDVITDSPALVFADHVENAGEELFEQVQRRGIEGVMAKRADSTYQAGWRSRDWLKIKAWQTQACVIAGFTSGQGRRKEHLGALILGVMRDGTLTHCGQVGTGFDDRLLRSLREQLDARVVDHAPFAKPPRTSEPATWVRPELVCEVRYADWTSAGILRHPAFAGLRPELTPADCTVDTATSVEDALPRHEGADDEVSGPRRRGGAATSRLTLASRRAPSTVRLGSVTTPPTSSSAPFDDALAELKSLRANDKWEIGGRRLALTNLDKPLWPDDGFTKRDMIAYYVRMADYLLPYLRGRPLSMQVFPDGINGKSFWRKDKPSYAPSWIDSWTYHGEKTKTYIVVNEVATLAWVANAGVIDLHPWHSRIDAPDQPDWAVFDLDPFEPATFRDVVDIAKLVKAAIDHFGMHGVIKTSGQTGLQIYVPLRRGPDYDRVRGWVEEVGRAIGQVARDRITWEWEVARRTGKIRIDYTQNIINKTLAAPYSLRPAPRAPVSAPIAWEELDDKKLRPDGWTIRTIARRVADVGDLFLGVLDADQDLPQ
jgi:bifunctional non-homologous end joining protein LigD